MSFRQTCTKCGIKRWRKNPKTHKDNYVCKYCNKWTKEKVRKAIIKIVVEKGRSPTISEISGALYMACKRNFGSWGNAKRSCGLKVYNSGEFTDMDSFKEKRSCFMKKWANENPEHMGRLNYLSKIARIGTKHSEKSKKKMSIRRKRLIKEGKIKVSPPIPKKGKENYFYGKRRFGLDNPFYGKHHTKKSKKKMGESKKGKYNGQNNPAWLGGISFEPYGFEFNKTLKEKIKTRDNYICQCNLGTHKGYLNIHHIDYNKKNNSQINLITVCSRHNSIANKNREFWKQYFQLKIFIKILFNPENILIYEDKLIKNGRNF